MTESHGFVMATAVENGDRQEGEEGSLWLAVTMKTHLQARKWAARRTVPSPRGSRKKDAVYKRLVILGGHRNRGESFILAATSSGFRSENQAKEDCAKGPDGFDWRKQVQQGGAKHWGERMLGEGLQAEGSGRQMCGGKKDCLQRKSKGDVTTQSSVKTN